MNAPAEVVNLQDAADKLFRENAMQDLAWRLKDGKDVAGVNLLQLLDSELDSRTITAETLLQILTDYADRHLLADRLVDGMIERFFSTPKGKEAVEEEMKRQDRYEPDPADWQEA